MMFNSTINLRTNVEHPISDIILVFTHQHPIPEIPMEIAMETTSTCTNFRSFQVNLHFAGQKLNDLRGTIGKGDG